MKSDKSKPIVNGSKQEDIDKKLDEELDKFEKMTLSLAGNVLSTMNQKILL